MPTAIPADPLTSRFGTAPAGRFFGGLVVVGAEIDGLLVEVGHHVVGERLEPRFRVAIAAGGSPSIDPKFPWPSTRGTAC